MSLVDRAISESWWLVKRILGRMKIVNVNGYRFGLPQNIKVFSKISNITS
jgi:hypothetical protein